MDKIEVHCNWSKIPRQKYSRFLAKRFYGWTPRIMIPIAAILTVIICVLAIHKFANPRDIPRSWAIAILPFYFGFMVFSLMNGYWKRRLFKALAAAPIRQLNRPFFLSKNGISNAGFNDDYAVGWRLITDVVETKEATLLMISPIEYFPIPDSGLPEGMTRMALLEQVSNWREMANGPT